MSLFPEEIVAKHNFEKIVKVERTKIFEVMAHIEKYPEILPKNVISINIIEKSDDFVIAKEKVKELGVETTLLVKHTIFPYEKHVIEILEGDAEGTRTIINFEENNNDTKISTEIEIHAKGILMPFGLLAQENIESAFNTILVQFVEYAQN